MKKILISALAVLSLTACLKDEVQTVNQSRAISFDNAFVGNATRAAADPSTTLETIADFKVWGFMDHPDGNVFQGELVERSGNTWSYTNTQYWAPEHTYYFAAVSPAAGNWSLETSGANQSGPGKLTFTNNDGTEDLLYAATSVDTPDYVTLAAGMDPVSLQFNHLLSKVKFTFKNGFRTPNAKIEIENIKMTAPETGVIDLATDNWWEIDAWQPAGVKTLEFGNVAKLEMGLKDECEYERLTIPVSKTYPYQVTFDVVLYMGEVEALRTHKTTEITGVGLELGKAYNFSAEINPENLNLPAIEFDVEVVNDWVDAETPCEQVTESEIKATALLGGKVVLTDNVTLTTPIVVTSHFEIDLNGYEINAGAFAEEGSTELTESYAFWVKNGGQLIINGNGDVKTAPCKYSMAVWANGGKVTINGGNYYNAGEGSDLIYASGAGSEVEIYSGYFKAVEKQTGTDGTLEKHSALNLKNNGKLGEKITVYGGTFYGFNPADNKSENPKVNFCAEGCVAVEKDGEWTVIPGEIEVGTASDFEAALAAKYQRITLTDDIVLTSDATYVIGNLILDLNGHSITTFRNHPPTTGETTSPRISTLYVDGVSMTVVGTGAIENLASTSAYSISIYNGAVVTIKGNVTVGAYHDAFYVHAGALYIENGFHYATNSLPVPEPCTLNNGKYDPAHDCHRSTVINCYDPNYQDKDAVVSITGGTFVNMNPTNVHEGQLHNRNFVAEGYTVTSEVQADGNIWYSVVPEV